VLGLIWAAVGGDALTMDPHVSERAKTEENRETPQEGNWICNKSKENISSKSQGPDLLVQIP
jgi:hypothetical protein